MLHKNRTWTLTELTRAEELAEKLTAHTWTGCTGFRLGKLLFLSDASSGNGAQEYAVVVEYPNGKYLQIESITFSWCSYDRALKLIKDLATFGVQHDKKSEWSVEVKPHIEPAKGHRCHHCA
jgi:hypothetical protein